MIIPNTYEEENFVRTLDSVGYRIIAIERDGNCLFRAISHQLYGDQNAHNILRQRCCDYIQQEKEYFSQFCWEESLDHRLARMRQNGTWGDNLELQALSELLGCPIEIFYLNNYPVMIYSSKTEGGRPIRLYFRNLCHYDSIVDTEAAKGAENPFGLVRQRSLTQNLPSITVINRSNSNSYFDSTVEKIINKSMSTLPQDEIRQTKKAIQESDDQATEDAILRMEMNDSTQNHGNYRPQKAMSEGQQTIKTKDFGIYKFAINLGYSMELAMKAHFLLEKKGPEVDAGEVLDFLLAEVHRLNK